MKFLRRGWYKHKRIGKGKKRMVGWRRPKGRDNKMRESRKGKSPLVSIGYKRQKENKKVRIVYNLKDLEQVKKGEIVILGQTGKKKKIEMAKKALEAGIVFDNLNIKKTLKKNEPK
jgi:large subunit ribosomal protein L32e